ncbi:hypothetical protein L228DRAFT_239112 [Xylona heveae TC161]|uniref:SPRY domain-containing protein n=1 Tax=Xylona heveae (strain CBS 132557 / TC161) TaxID=1328760 RepID=A0A165GEN7_XYLHT|nr:hypothetical protein L228DRAFT_239112 [Xylona heveae TC161]KZF22098.1 hypothetical protein L228DRAFT_239112 [Xylona heveae TC161]
MSTKKSKMQAVSKHSYTKQPCSFVSASASQQQPPPYEHNWRIIPDNALLPPPPSIGHDKSPTSNATKSAAEQGQDWCETNPLWTPRTVFSAVDTLRRREGRITLTRPRHYQGSLNEIMPASSSFSSSSISSSSFSPPSYSASASSTSSPEVHQPPCSSPAPLSSWKRNLFGHFSHRQSHHDDNDQQPHHYQQSLSSSSKSNNNNGMQSFASGTWRGKTTASCEDATLLSDLPLYASTLDSPLFTEGSKTIYYEARFLGPSSQSSQQEQQGDPEYALALGFVAQPYPSFRLPGWHRGSLAIHGDDGRRYVNDMWGGKDFTRPFAAGDVLGIGMTFELRLQDGQDPSSQNPSSIGQDINDHAADETTQSSTSASASAARRRNSAGVGVNAKVFFTRNGRLDGSWDLHEEIDSKKDLSGTAGLDGGFDIFAAVGVYGGVEFEVDFNPATWVWKGMRGPS